MKAFFKNFLIPVIIFCIIYVLMGNTRSVHNNPFISDAVIALNMIVIVVAGLVLGVRGGIAVGFFGTLLNSLVYSIFSYEYFIYEILAVLPHMVMGGIAGYLKDRVPLIVSSLSIVIGHVLNISVFIIFGLLSIEVLYSSLFIKGILYEIFIGLIGIVISIGLYHCVEDGI